MLGYPATLAESLPVGQAAQGVESAGYVEVLVGRKAETAALERFIETAAPADSRLLVIEGAAGIGKTSLWRSVVAGARRQGTLVLSSAPGETEANLPYVVLRDLLDRQPASALAGIPDPLRDALQAALFRAPTPGPPVDQLAVASASLNLVQQLAGSRPILLAVDDVQFADRTSLAILGYMVRRLDAEPVRVLFTLRTPQRRVSLRRSFGNRHIGTIRLGPLAPKVIDDILERRLERPLSTPDLERVHSISRGNPYFALEIGRQLLDEPAIARAGGHMAVPSSLRELLENRIRRLPPKTQELLVAMAALDRPDLRVLDELDSVGARLCLEKALDAHLVERTDGGFRFAHPLLASVVYSMAGPARRRQLHARLADLVADPEQRARHLALATTLPTEAVAELVEGAARSAHLRGAPAEAATLARDSIDLTPPEHVDALERRRTLLAESLLRSGDANAARAVLKSVLHELPPNGQPAQGLRLLAAVEFGAGNLPEVVRLLDEALERCSNDLHLQAVVERDLVHAHSQQGHFGEALEHSRRLARIAVQTGDPGLSATALRMQAVNEQHLGGLSADSKRLALAIVEGSVELLDDAVGSLHPMLDWAVVLKWSDDFGHARQGLRRSLELTEGRDESLRAPVLFHLAELECWTGDWAAAEQYVAACEYSVRHSGLRSFTRLHLTATALLHCCRGELSAAEQAAAEALRVATHVGDHPFRQRALGVLGLKELSAGDPQAAWRHFQRLGEGPGQIGFQGAVRTTGDEVEALVGLGRLEDARQRCASLGGQSGPWQRAIAARCRGLIAAATGDLQAAVAEFESALRAHRDLEMPLEEARTLLLCGSTLRRARRWRAAEATLRQALGKFEALGAREWSSRTREQLQLIGGHAAPNGDHLSRREHEVATLVAKGLSNEEVSQRLFISRRTAESHVEHILGKLGLRNRSELVAWILAQDKHPTS